MVEKNTKTEGRFQVRLGSDLNEWLTEIASKEHRNKNGQIIYFLNAIKEGRLVLAGEGAA